MRELHPGLRRPLYPPLRSSPKPPADPQPTQHSRENMKDLTIDSKQELFSFTPTSLAEAMEYSKIIADSDLVPKDYKGKPGNVLVAVQMGMEVGLKPLQAIQNIAVVNGRPSLWGDAMLALVRAHASFESILEEQSETEATCTVKRKGDPEKTVKFTMEDAKKAGLSGKEGAWRGYPKRMMQMRARGFALRDMFPDILKGLSIAEEARDYIDVESQDISEVAQKAKALRDELKGYPGTFRAGELNATMVKEASSAEGAVKLGHEHDPRNIDLAGPITGHKAAGGSGALTATDGSKAEKVVGADGGTDLKELSRLIDKRLEGCRSLSSLQHEFYKLTKEQQIEHSGVKDLVKKVLLESTITGAA